MRCYSAWYRFIRQCLVLASIPPGSILNPATNFERLTVLYFPPHAAKLPSHDKHFNGRSDAHELLRLQMRGAVPGEQPKAHLQGLGRVIRKISELRWGDSRRMLLRQLAGSFEEIVQAQEAVGSSCSAAGLSYQSFCLPALRHTVAALRRGNGDGGSGETTRFGVQSSTHPLCKLSYFDISKPAVWSSEASEWGCLFRDKPPLGGGRPRTQERSHNSSSVAGCAGGDHSQERRDTYQGEQSQHTFRCVRLMRTRWEQVFFGSMAGGKTDSDAQCFLPFLCDGMHEIFQERSQKYHGHRSDAGILFRHGGSLGLPPGARARLEETERKKQFPEWRGGDGGATKGGLCGGICDTIRDHRLPSGGIGADDKGEFDQLAGEVGVPEQTLREGVGARLENGSVRGRGLPVHSCSDFIWFAAPGVDAPFVLRREGFKVGGDMACDRFQGKVVDWSGTDEFDGDPGVEKVSGEGFAGEQRSKPFSGLPEICRLGYRSNALIQALRHSYLEVEGKPSRNSEFFREMVCSGWFKNVSSLRQTVRSGKCGSFGDNVNKGTSKTWEDRRAQERCWTSRGQQIRVGSAGGNEDKTNEWEGGDG